MTMSCYFHDYTVQYTAEPFVKTCSGTPHQLRYITVTVSGIARGGGWGGGGGRPPTPPRRAVRRKISVLSRKIWVVGKADGSKEINCLEIVI